jgi:hypothetical protein
LNDLPKNCLPGARRRGSLEDFRDGPLESFLAGRPIFEVGGNLHGMPPDETQQVVFAGCRLQAIADYRGALQAWFKAVRVGGCLVIAVPHAFLADRQLSLPAEHDPAQMRLYTPASLLSEIEEALVPNSYRVRWLGDDDSGYDYGSGRDPKPVGAREVLLAIERIALPAWPLCDPPPTRTRPDFSFEPERTRVEVTTLRSRRRILILKLDHIGDFIMGLPALERARTTFADAEITLVVGSWNVEMANGLAIADRVLSFDAFPRNSSEEKVDVVGKTALFEQLMTDEYDLAIDLRNDLDTRFLLQSVRAPLRAAVGTPAQFPFLDIFLPVDFNRNDVEAARSEELPARAFASQDYAVRSEFRIFCKKEKARRDGALIWGPYIPLRSGRYIFEPYLELDPAGDGLLSLDIALNMHGLAETTTIMPRPEPVRLTFSATGEGSLFEFRIWAIADTPAIDFSFFGGRLIRAGAASVLHQSEYLELLIELIAMRLDRRGVLTEAGQQP